MKRRKAVMSSDSEEGEMMETDTQRGNNDDQTKAYEKMILMNKKTEENMEKLKEIIESLKNFAARTPNLHREAKETINEAYEQCTAVEQAFKDETEANNDYKETVEELLKEREEKREMQDKEVQCQIERPTKRNITNIGNINTKKGGNNLNLQRRANEGIEEEGSTQRTNNGEEQETWAKVIGRKQKKTTLQTEDIAKTQNKKPKSSAIEIKINKEEDYMLTLKKVKADAKMAENGDEITRVRKTRSGNVLIEIKNGSTKTEHIKEAVKNVLGEDSQVKALIPTLKLEIRDIDGAADIEEIQEAIYKKLGTDKETTYTKAVAIYPTYGGMQRAIVIANSNEAKKLLKEGKIVIGWLSCAIKEKLDVKKCYRCLRNGHLAAECEGVDRSKKCRKCGQEGHSFKDCKNELCCMLCSEKGYSRTKHWIGSKTCDINQHENPTD